MAAAVDQGLQLAVSELCIYVLLTTLASLLVGQACRYTGHENIWHFQLHMRNS